MPYPKPSTPSLGVCYYPEHWDEGRWPTDLQRMWSLGIRYVRVGEFAWFRFEPEPEKFDFSWLQRFLDLAQSEGLAVVVGTPTASPPKWLVDSMPDMIALDEDGLPRAFGSRRHSVFHTKATVPNAGGSSRGWPKRWVLTPRFTVGRSTMSTGATTRQPRILPRPGRAFDSGCSNIITMLLP